MTAELPSIGEAIAPLRAEIPRAEQPPLTAYAERLAAERDRGWARLPEAILAAAARC